MKFITIRGDYLMHALHRASIVRLLYIALPFTLTRHTLYTISNGISLNNLNMFSSLFSFPFSVFLFHFKRKQNCVIASIENDKCAFLHDSMCACVCMCVQKREEYAKYLKRKLKNRPIDKCCWLRLFFIVSFSVRFICLFVCLLLFRVWYSKCHSKTKAIWSHYGVDSQNFVSSWRCDAFHVYIFPFIRVCVLVSQHQRHTIQHTHRLAHTCTYGVDWLCIQLKEKSHVQTSCSPSSILCHTHWYGVYCIRSCTWAKQKHAHTHGANSPWTRASSFSQSDSLSVSVSYTRFC